MGSRVVYANRVRIRLRIQRVVLREANLQLVAYSSVSSCTPHRSSVIGESFVSS